MPVPSLAHLVPAAALALALAAGPSARADALPPTRLTPEQQALHLLSRLGYGPRPGDVAAIVAMGPERYIAEQLDPESIAEDPALEQRLAALTTLRLNPEQLFHDYGPPLPPPGIKPSQDEVKAARERARIIGREAAEARVLRAIASRRQLDEVMTEFWFNHFNVFEDKGLDYLWTGAFEEEAIRPYALGRFRDLLAATARHPAMLFYLDNWQNTAPGSAAARGNEKGINENYAREIMELHTLGVDGGYSQQDVTTLAHVLTGWGLKPGRGARHRVGSLETDANGWYFDEDRHDFSDKLFLGERIRGRGAVEIEEALDMLARQPATARHLAFELAQYFVADQPPPALVGRMAQRYLETGGIIREVLWTLFTSPEFWDPAFVGHKYKSPYKYVISAVRLSGEPVLNVQPLLGTSAQLGERLYGYLTPDGYSDTREAWLSPDAMTRRLNFATALGSGHLPIDVPPGEKSPGHAPLDPERLRAALGAPLSATTEEAVAAAPPPLRAAVILGSPEFMQR
ncbi:MAG: DUF1800 domain-containing protein [Alphaproteobacteria bacterium]|nr:DUF1800 domain-containing protein [Alphaproteobacteria bacterium]